MKVWITKYALTKGVSEKEAEISTFSSMCTITTEWGLDYYHKPDWHESREDALAQAEKMRTARIDSLKKQIAKLQGMRFK